MRALPPIPPGSSFDNPPSVVLARPGDQPIVRGLIKPRLTLAQYHVVKALLDAGDEGLSKNLLDAKSGHSEARKILRRLAESDPDWAAVIQLAGSPGRRYHIV